MKDKTVLITGADGAIGRQTVKALAHMGAEIIMAVVDAKAAGPLCEAIRRESGNGRIRVMELDLSSLARVREFAAQVLPACRKLDVLVNCAGVFCLKRQVTCDGFEKTMAVNYLGLFLLTRLLLPPLQAAPQGRILNFSSNAYKQAKLDLSDLQTARAYKGMKAYSASKLAVVLFSRELARRLEGTGVTVNALHPGHVASGMWDLWGNPAWYQKLFVNIFKRFLITPEQGAQNGIYLASSAEVANVSGKYFDNKRPVAVSAAGSDAGLQGDLWRLSETLTGLAGCFSAKTGITREDPGP